MRFLARAANLWNSELPFGQAQNRPMDTCSRSAFSGRRHPGAAGLGDQRLWWALLLTVGFWGLLRVARRWGSAAGFMVLAAPRRAVAARADHDWRDLVGTLPMMLAPWVLLPVILAPR